ncbi:MAG TPA: GNAT family N-acetyltransferase [Candidatus Solibacter sp.]|nr:GNAT family N-acetyltransferase [Candidatus Solibacter sp.]
MHTSLSNKIADKLTIDFLEPSNREAWDEFCLQSGEAWFWHTTKWLDYTLDYRPERSPVSYCFSVSIDGKMAAICPLVLETSRDEGREIRQFSYGGDPVPAPAFADGLSAKAKKAARRAVFGQIDELAATHRVQRVSFRVPPPAPFFWRSNYPLANPLLHEGFSDISLLTQVVDLSKPEDQLFREIRNDHRNDIKHAQKLLSTAIFDRDNITSEQFERYRLLHRKAAGRTTRPLSTFEMMLRWIQEGLAVLSCAMLDGNDIGFALFSVYKDGAYYSSSCNDPEFNHLPIGHLLQWHTMKWLKAHGIRFYESGVQHFGPQAHDIGSRKDWNISCFKRGFGGVTVPFWRAEKFYDEEFCLRTLQERARAYAQTVKEARSSPRE